MSSKKTTPKQASPQNKPVRATTGPVQPDATSGAAKQPAEAMQPASAASQASQPKQPTAMTKQAPESNQPVRAVNPPEQPKQSPPSASAAGQARQYERFHWTQRSAHVLLLASFTLLGITGLPQKFAQAGWAQAMIAFFGGIETTRLIHHISAIVLILLGIYHFLDIGYKIFVRRTSLSMLPSLKDVKDALQAFLYNLGFGKSRPQMGRYTFEEKAEYWALIWGTVVMAITGFMMWNPISTSKFLPGEIIPAAKAAHGGEALLAVMAIVVWHMYGVHIKRFNKAMWTGKQTETEMLHEHPLELADIKAGLDQRVVDGKTLRKRRVVFFPIASVLAVAMLLGVYGFVSGEKTAITTVLPISSPVAIYVPQMPTPSPTPLPTATPAASGSGAPTWNGTVGLLLQTKCGMCHGASLATNGLSFATYAGAIQGAQDGPVIVPGNVNGSKLIVIQSTNTHPGQLSVDELTIIKSWIAVGAPEK
jgi:cytochrome b subunit of formate dehydrogenase